MTINQNKVTDKKSRYYDSGGIECLDYMRAKLTPEQFRGYLQGSIIKYISRLNFKHKNQEEQAREAEKSEIYSRLLKEFLLDSELSCGETVG